MITVTNFEPKSGYALVSPEERPSKTESGILLLESTSLSGGIYRGKIVNDPDEYVYQTASGIFEKYTRAGKTIYYTAFIDLKLDGIDYHLVKDDNILGYSD